MTRKQLAGMAITLSCSTRYKWRGTSLGFKNSVAMLLESVKNNRLNIVRSGTYTISHPREEAAKTSYDMDHFRSS